MVNYECAKCSRVFGQKSHYEKHLARKTACKPPLTKVEPPSDFRDTSEQLHTVMSKTYRQDNGIFFTPLPVRNKVFDVLKDLNCNPNTILEPSFGS